MSQNVFITSKPCGEQKCINVSKHLVKDKSGADLTFHNNLDGTTGLTVKFYDADAKGMGIPYSDFCFKQTTEDFAIAGGAARKCSLMKGDGDYAYSVQAAGYIELDPIIIIEPQVALSMAVSYAMVGVALIAVAFVAFRLGKGRSSS